MNKKEIRKKAIKAIKRDIKLLICYQNEGNWKMYGHTFTCLLGKVAFLRELDIINFEQWRTLSSIIYKV